MKIGFGLEGFIVGTIKSWVHGIIDVVTNGLFLMIIGLIGIGIVMWLFI